MMGGGSDDRFTEMSSKWWAVVVTIFLMKCPVNDERWRDDRFNEMSSKWWAVVVTFFLLKCPVNDGRW